MQDYNNAAFKFKAIIRLGHAPDCDLRKKLNTVSDLSFTSRIFNSYPMCADSATGLIDDFVSEISKGDQKFKRIVEVSPLHGGNTTILSSDWEDHEISRLWVYSVEEDKNAVKNAIAQISIMLAYDEEPVRQLN